MRGCEHSVTAEGMMRVRVRVCVHRLLLRIKRGGLPGIHMAGRESK